MTELEPCPCDECGVDCDYWDRQYCWAYCRWYYGDTEPPCEFCGQHLTKEHRK